jgi:hypothetical protein
MVKWEWPAWGEMLHAVQTGETGFRHAYGMDYFEYLKTHPDAGATFDEAMSGFVSMNGMAALGVYDFSVFKKVVDVGGGNGTLITAILNSHPSIRGVVVDLPNVISRTQERITVSGLLDRCECVGMDIFDSVPIGGDGYLLVSIVHDWADEPSRKILKNCRRAMSLDSKLLLIEMIIPPADEPFFGKILDLEMLVSIGGQERTLEEYAELLRRSGFGINRVIPTPGPSSIIEAVPR